MADTIGSQTNVNIIPRGNNVIVKMSFKASVLSLVNNKWEDKDNDVAEFEIAGIGNKVNDPELKLGDKVVMELSQKYSPLDIKGNERSVDKLQEFYRKLTRVELTDSMRDNPKVDVVQYGLFPEFLVKGIIR